jgi:two-component system chemotaxis response regulator CheB
MKKIRVLIVDDSIFFRENLRKVFQNDNQIEIVGTAGDPFEARDKILALNPDVLTLDIEMPKMNGIEFLEKLIPQYPIPVVVVSGAPVSAFDALDAGAVDFVKKPQIQGASGLSLFANEMHNKILIASHARVHQPRKKSGGISYSGLSHATSYTLVNAKQIIAMGASTGGTDALQAVLSGIPAGCPPIVIVQHMPPVFTRMFAERLDKLCKIEVREAKNMDRCKGNLALLAPGDTQMKLMRDAQGYYVKIGGTDKVSGHCPSVDVLFNTAAEVAGKNTIGVIMTGMGSDGAKGMVSLRQTGAYTIGQNKETCVVYGMPMVAFQMGGVMKQLPLDHISQELVNRYTGVIK